MQNFNISKVLLLIFFIILPIKYVEAANILPLPKPTVEQETKKRVDDKNTIYPKKKPSSEVKKDENTQTQEIQNVQSDTEQNKFIYPKKKPLIVKKQVDKAVSKSLILSKKDFKIAKSVFQAIDKKKWQTATKLSKKARNKILYNLVNYLHLIQSSNFASFYDYSLFIHQNPDYPRINRLRYLAEHKINFKNNSPKSILKWFNGKEPLSDFGKIKLAEIYLQQGKMEEGSRLLKEAWIKAKLSKNNL